MDRIQLGLSGVVFGQSLAVVLGALMVADEYTTGLVGTTLLASPRRLALGVAFVLRDTAAALAVVLSLLYLVPLMGFALDNETLTDLTSRYAPMPAGFAIQTTVGAEALPIGNWAGQAVMAGWSAFAIITGWVVFAARDA